jgi:hypothetical protein
MKNNYLPVASVEKILLLETIQTLKPGIEL